MLTPLAAGALAFALFVLFDLCKAYTRARRPGLLFAAGGLLLAGAAARLFFPPAPGWTCSFSSGSAPAGRWRRRSTLRITPAFRTAQTEPRWQTA